MEVQKSFKMRGARIDDQLGAPYIPSRYYTSMKRCRDTPYWSPFLAALVYEHFALCTFFNYLYLFE